MSKVNKGFFVRLVIVILIAWLFYDFDKCSIALIVSLPFVWIKSLKEKREMERMNMSECFKDALELLLQNLNVGYSMENAVFQISMEIEKLHGEKHPLVKGFRNICGQISTGVPVEDAFEEYSQKVGVEEISYFSDLLKNAKRGGGQMSKLISDTSKLIAKKLEIKREKNVATASKRLEVRIMTAMPFFIIFYLRFFMTDMMNTYYHNMWGILFMTGMVFAWLAAGKIGEKVLNRVGV